MEHFKVLNSLCGKTNQLFSYEFLKIFHKTIHYSNLPGRNNAKNIKQATIIAIVGRG